MKSYGRARASVSNGPVSQSAEEAVSKTVKCGFESHQGYYE